MRISIEQHYDMVEGKPYCLINFYADDEIHGEDGINYNCAFELPTSLSTLDKPSLQIMKNILDHLQNSINEIFHAYEKDNKKGIE